MIRINLLPQPRPKAKRAAVSAGAGLQLILLLVGFVLGLGTLGVMYKIKATELDEARKVVTDLQREKAALERVKMEVEDFQRRKAVLDQRIAVIQELQRNRVGGQELLDAIANTVTRTETLWLTNMNRKENTLTIDGSAASVTAVANFITQLKRSGYFEKVEIKETHQDDKNTAVVIFLFRMTAEFVLPGSKPPEAAGKS